MNGAIALRRAVVRGQAVVIAALAVAGWAGAAASVATAALAVGTWIARRAETGRWSLATTGALPTLALLGALPLTLLVVVDWPGALARLGAIVSGLALAHAVATTVTSERALVGTAALLVGVGGLLAAASPFIADWPIYKTPVFPALTAVYAQFPTVVSGLTRGTTTGAIHVNQLAGVVSALLPLGLAVTVVGGRARWWRLLAAALAAVALMALMLALTQSRSGYLGAAVGCGATALWLIVRTRPRWAWAWVGAIGLAGVAVGALVVPRAARWLQVDEASVDSLPGRLELWDRAWLMIQDFPFTGVGLNQFSRQLHERYEPLILPPDGFVPHAHNVVLQLGVDLGVLGAAAALALGGVVAARVGATAVRGRSATAALLAIGWCGGMIGFAVYGLTDAIAIGARGALPLWALLGLGMAIGRAEERCG